MKRWHNRKKDSGLYDFLGNMKMTYHYFKLKKSFNINTKKFKTASYYQRKEAKW